MGDYRSGGVIKVALGMCLIIISLIGLIYRIKRKKEKQRIYHIIGNCVDSDCDYLDFVLISVFSGALLMGLVLKIQNIFQVNNGERRQIVAAPRFRYSATTVTSCLNTSDTRLHSSI